ncbi:SDA1-domain-containing protein [Rhodotorula diobovata]|uniref:SDA1-domain-containing protein n=1 Tax=Rhodotorula diobovata TaxID=5288 RepID=A0A5C5FNZ9_9BASI|nr:SDA1-domain-containing protein [Rhodotorula diobovata]
MPSVAASSRPAASVAGSRASSSRSRNPAAASTPVGEGLRKTQRGALITNSLPALQNLIKRSPDSYAEEFAVQWARFGSLVKIVQLGLGGAKGDEEQLKEVTGFVCQVAHLYPTLTASLPSILSGLLLASAPATSTSAASTAAGPTGVGSAISGGGVQLSPETRKTMMQGLVLLRRREVISGVDLLKTLFPLLSITTSPNLRTVILKTIIGDIKNANTKTRAVKLNSMVQGLLMVMIERGIAAEQERVGTGVKASRRGASTSKDGKVVGAREAMWAVKIASELWRKNVWRGDKMTVKVVARACFHPDTKVQSAAMHFFLVTPDSVTDLDSDDEEDEGPDIQAVKHRQEINKKRKSTDRKAKREIRAANAKRRQKEQASKDPQSNFSALQQLDDAYSFGERLYEQLVKYDKAYTLEHKVLMMQLLGRVCGTFKLTIPAFYSYVLRYLTHHQLQITQILVALAQSVHDQIPAGGHDETDDVAQQEQDDPLYPVLRKLANEFVHSGVAAEVNAAGLNAITEICRRQPLAMSPDLLQDLVEYRKSKDKGVMVAARGLLQLYREVNPTLLKRRDVGKSVSMQLQEERRGGAESVAAGAEERKTALKFGEDRETVKGIQGLDLFAKHLAEQAQNADGEAPADQDEDDEAGWDGWEAESGSESDSSGGWVNVESEGESDLEISDSDDDDEDKARKRRKVEAREAREAKKRGLEAVAEEDEEDEASPPKKRAVDVAATKADDEIVFDQESGSEDEDEEDSDDESGSSDNEEQAPRERTEEEQDEMSLTRANKVLEGTMFAEIAMSKILTPADFVKINELRVQAAEDEAKNGGGSAARRKLAALAAARKANHGDTDDAFLAEDDILGLQKKKKNSYEERMAKIQEGRADRDKFGSHRHKKLDSKAHSTTNAEKRRGKNFMMMAHSHEVVRKSRASLHQKSRKLRNHVKTQKSGGRRRNGEHK